MISGLRSGPGLIDPGERREIEELKQKIQCCNTPVIKGYPEENPVSYVCLKCGKWV
jgi:hypothetical protein